MVESVEREECCRENDSGDDYFRSIDRERLQLFFKSLCGR